jgi:mannose-6-phosphate isomerase-like protein (cupin superfamily)
MMSTKIAAPAPSSQVFRKDSEASTIRRSIAEMLIVLVPLACGAASPAVIAAANSERQPDWTEAELSKETAVRLLRQSEHESHHLLRTVVSEKPHVHERSDLTAVVLAGHTRMHIRERSFALRPGDVVHVPKGVPHWLELLDDSPASAYVIFAPAFDPNDRRFTD